MNNKTIEIKQTEGFAIIAFLLQNLLLLLCIGYLLYSFIDTRINNEVEFESIQYVLFPLLVIGFYQLLIFISNLFSFETLIIDDEFLTFNDKKYPISDIGFKFPSTFQKTTLTHGTIFAKDSGETIIILFFSFWAGSLLNISGRKFYELFNHEMFLEDYLVQESVEADKLLDKKIFSNKLEQFNIDTEAEEIKQTFKMIYILSLIAIVPIILLILFL